MKKVSFVIVALVVICLAAVPAAHAQASRTWVSGVGDDANPCSRTAPCKTFPGAISKTAPAGEISVLDPGGFGVVTITKSITINGDGTLAGILAAGANGVIINAAATDKVVLRNLSIVGFNTGLNGIRFLQGGQLVIDKCTISGFNSSATSRGIDVSLSDSVGATFKSVVVTDSVITNNQNGMRVGTTSADDAVQVTLDNVRIVNSVLNGFESAQGLVRAAINDSVISHNGSDGVRNSSSTGQVAVEGCFLRSNSVAINSAASALGSPNEGRIRISGNTIVNNATSITIAAGAFVASPSPGTNRVAANAAGVAPNEVYTQQ